MYTTKFFVTVLCCRGYAIVLVVVVVVVEKEEEEEAEKEEVEEEREPVNMRFYQFWPVSLF